ncbi:hypothetical protein DUNSADRAFT_2702 [Dunaliella salina]|uniref:Encoded protein n=1 Tax=Dunaliella salina TaxID=3046 RepID=A0ABQ7H8A9_DUNSA|nr:hypothetical protein DUNSADRAFT_2702 [Dunaliella salina]|eukprot:KAF5843089.1 hypothetical protein DUNSADRAFT_2702 [Dunaliella salina]
MQGTLLAQAEAATSPHAQRSLPREVGSYMKARGLMLEGESTHSASTAETLLAEAAAAEAGTAGPVSLGQQQTLAQEQQSQPSDELPVHDPLDQHVHQQHQYQQHQQLLGQPTLPQPCKHHKAVHCQTCMPSAPLNLPLCALQGAQRSALPTTPIAGPLQDEVAASSSHDNDSDATRLRASVPTSCSKLCAEEDTDAASAASTPTTLPPTPGPSVPIVQADSSPSVPPTPGPSIPILQAASPTSPMTSDSKSTHPSFPQASMDVNGSSSEDGHSNGLQTTIGTGLRTTTDGPCSAPTGSGMPSLPFPLPDTHTRLSISTCASHAHGPRQSQPTSAHAPSAAAFSTGGAHAQHQNPAHAPPRASSPEADTAAVPDTTSEKGGSNGGPVVGAPKLSSFALLHPAAAGGMVPMHQPQQQQHQQLLQQSGPLLAGSDVAQVRKCTAV